MARLDSDKMSRLDSVKMALTIPENTQRTHRDFYYYTVTKVTCSEKKELKLFENINSRYHYYF